MVPDVLVLIVQGRLDFGELSLEGADFFFASFQFREVLGVIHFQPGPFVQSFLPDVNHVFPQEAEVAERTQERDQAGEPVQFLFQSRLARGSFRVSALVAVALRFLSEQLLEVEGGPAALEVETPRRQVRRGSASPRVRACCLSWVRVCLSAFSGVCEGDL